MFTAVYICVLICDIDCVLLVCTLQIFHFPAQLVVFVGAGLHPVVRQQNCRVSDRTRHLMNPYSMLHVFVFLVIVISFLFKQEYSRCNLKTPFKTGVLTKTEAYKVLNKRKMLRMFSKWENRNVCMSGLGEDDSLLLQSVHVLFLLPATLLSRNLRRTENKNVRI